MSCPQHRWHYYPQMERHEAKVWIVHRQFLEVKG